MKFKIFEDETELINIENFLAKELEVPYVKCSYDIFCSHKSKENHELEYRKQEGILEPNEYVINYELYETTEDYKDNEGGYDGDVYELIYTIENDYIVVQYY